MVHIHITEAEQQFLLNHLEDAAKGHFGITCLRNKIAQARNPAAQTHQTYPHADSVEAAVQADHDPGDCHQEHSVILKEITHS